MIKIFGIPACNTMKKTFEYFKEKGLDYEFHDYKKSGIDLPTLSLFVDELGIEIVLNKKGSTYRQLSDEEKSKLTSNEAILSYLQQKTSAIKRPIIIQNKHVIAGFDPIQLDKWLNI